MGITSTRKRTQQHMLRTAIAAAVATSFVPCAVTAQEEGEKTSDTIVVTGSRIQRDEFSSSSPISVFGTADIEASGVVSVDEFLKEIPAFTGFQQNTSTNNGSDGQKKVDLRGLGFNRTLVLINGRRQIGDVNGDGAVDLNTIPEALIERIEVLKDGASTVYGSDAIAGVINVILKKNIDGIELSANYGAGTEDGQAENKGFSIAGGVSNDRGSVVAAISYSEQKEMLQADRPWALFDLFPGLDENGNFVAVPSGSSNSRRIRVPGAGFRIVDAETGQARPFTGADVYNFAPVNALITPNEHWQISTLGNIEMGSGVNGYFEGLYTRRTSQQRLAPDASFSVTSSFVTPNNGPQWNDFVPASNPFNPYGVNPRNAEGLSGLDVRINRRFVESGGRLFVQGADTFRLVTGVQGELLNTGINWDLSYTFAQNEVLNDTLNYGRFDRWATAVDPAACQADAACRAAMGNQTALNPFDDYGSITPEQMAYISAGSLKDRFFGQMNLLALNLDGGLFAMPGGEAKWALGYEVRKEKGEFSPDTFLGEGLTTSGPSDPQSGAFTVKEVYGELLLPLHNTLSLDLSARHSDYDTSAGSKTTYKAGIDYSPVSILKLRAGYGTGFRAPNISELNQGDVGTFPIVETVCDYGDRRLAAGDISQTAYDNCIAMGADTSDEGALPFAWQSLQTFRAPTVPLKPEESKTFHLGAVVTPISGLALGVDWWRIEVDKLIGVPDINDLLTACINSVGFSNIACGSFDTDGDGEPDGVGVGQPYYQDEGVPADVVTDFGNLGKLVTSGVDFNADYTIDVSWGAITKVNLNWGATYLNSYKRTFDLTGERELAGTANGFAVFPKWRSNVEVGVSGSSWSAAWQLRWIDETKDALRPASATDDAVAESIVYHDLVGSYTWRNIKLFGGINNVTDEDPPFFHSAFNAETEPGMYDVIGRRLFLGTKVTF